nr:CheR family methyltransferase [Parvularcula maris]
MSFPVIGIGASAGGLEAVTEMLREGDPNTGMAFVLVQHLDPNHESMLPELLSRKTRLSVRQVRKGDRIEPDTLHIIPPGNALSIEEGRFVLTAFDEPRGLRRPIDTFLESLGAAQGADCACVILSGTGADGSEGLRTVKEMGGVVLVQSPETSRYDGMPNSAIATGLADHVMPTGEMFARLHRYFSSRDKGALLGSGEELESQLDEIVRTLRDSVGHDFSGYKHPTLVRRISRHMQLTEKLDPDEYIAFLRASPAASEALFRDLLINVTNFFRDKEYFDLLRREVVEPLVESTPRSHQIRVWVPGCSSGQEAYSLAMLFDHVGTRMNRRPLVQIFATDVDDTMIRIAREGHYPTAALKDIPEEFRNSYTIGMDSQFRIAPRVRDMVRFSVHNLVKDPPFSNLDLISCRNLLIYLTDKVQQHLIPLMHYSLRPGGFLFLGPSESIARREDLFAPIDQKARLFKRKDTHAREPIRLPLGVDTPRVTAPRSASPSPYAHLEERTETPNTEIMERFAPPFVRINEDGDVRGSSGDLSPYLKSYPGERDQHIFRLAREGLRETVFPLIMKARKTGRRQAAKDIEVESQFGIQTVDVVAEPLREGLLALVFINVGQFRQKLQDYYIEGGDADDRVNDLEAELRLTRYRLRGAVEELETANEELKSSNEEMMSANEELQSANEELSTVNEELKHKVDELGVVNADLANFLTSIKMAVVVVDRDLMVRTFTDQSRQIFPFQNADKGRPLSEINLLVDEVNLLSDVQHCIEHNEPVERVVENKDNTMTFIMRILPYKSAAGEVDGATLTFNDITRLKRLENDVYEKTERLRLAMSIGEIGVWEIDLDTDIVECDETLLRLFDMPEKKEVTVTDFIDQIHPDDRDRVLQDFEKARRDRGAYEQEFRIPLPDGSVRWLKGVGQLLQLPAGQRRMLGLNYDITFEEEARENQQLLVREMNHRVKNLFAVVSSLINTTAKRASNVPDYAVSLRDRVNALGRAYELTQNKTVLANVDLHSLLQKILAPHGTAAEVTLEGTPVDVPVDAITPISLIVHELATNAVKYGGLSSQDAELAIHWKTEEDGSISLQWKEKGSQPSKGAGDAAHGFGTKLIDASVRQLRGSIERQWTEEGLHALLTIRLPGNHR